MGKINLYNCKDCGNTIVTEDIDEGTTPMMLMCTVYDGCKKGSMMSMMYNIPDILVASHEWYKPSIKEVSNIEHDHVKKGGLLLRKRKI